MTEAKAEYSIQSLTSLLAGGIITQSEFDRFEKRVNRAQAVAAEAADANTAEAYVGKVYQLQKARARLYHKKT